jgi:hypothetical protein
MTVQSAEVQSLCSVDVQSKCWDFIAKVLQMDSTYNGFVGRIHLTLYSWQLPVYQIPSSSLHHFIAPHLSHTLLGFKRYSPLAISQNSFFYFSHIIFLDSRCGLVFYVPNQHCKKTSTSANLWLQYTGMYQTNPGMLQTKGTMYFVCRLCPLSPPRQCLGPTCHLYTNTVSPKRACLIIWWERFRGTQKEDDCGPLSIQSLSLVAYFAFKSQPHT